MIMTNNIIKVGEKRKLKLKIGHNYNFRPAIKKLSV